MNTFETYRQQIETQIATTKAKALNANQIANATTADTLLSDLLVSNANTQQVFLTLLDQLSAGGVNNSNNDPQYVVSTVNDPALDDALTALTNAVNTAIAGLIGTQTAMNTYLQALGDLTALHNSITAQVTVSTTNASNAGNAAYAANLAAEVASGTLEAIQQQYTQITTTAAAVANDRALTQTYKDTTLGYRNEVFTALSTLSTGYYPAGQWNAATNTAPPTPTEGAPVYRIINTGTIQGVIYHEGDDIFWNGTNGWFKVDNSERFTSINGYTSGSINITYLDVGAASALQGTKADTAVQPSDLGVYVTATSLTNRLTDYVTASNQNVTLASYATNNALTNAIGTITTALAGKATAAQGALADTAVQPADLLAYSTTATMNSAINTALASYVTTTTLNSNLSGYVSNTALDTRLLDYASAAQGTKADSAVQPAALSSYHTVNAFNTAMTAYTTTSALTTLLAGYASSAQGAKADSAVQPAALSAYVTTSAMNTALSAYVTSTNLATTLAGYASSAQGSKADTAVQPAALSAYVTNTSLATTLTSYITGTLTNSTTDATVGRVLKVGDFGIGTVAVANTNWDAITASGIYVNSGTGDTGIPVAVTGLVLEHTGIDTNNATQLAMATSSNRLWMRRKVTGSWQAWVELYHSGNLSNLVVGGGLTINGDLIVNGSTSSTTTSIVTSTDPVLQLGGAAPLTSDDGKDRGVMYRWYNGAASKLGFFGLHEGTGHFTFIPDATNTGEVFTGAVGTIDANLSGNASTASALASSVSIGMTGDLTWSIPAFTGSGNVSAVGTLANTAVTAGSYGDASHVTTFTVDSKGRLTAAGTVLITPAAIGAATSAQGAKADSAVQPATLTSYVTSSNLTTTLASYVTNSSLSTTLAGYASSAQGAKADSAVQPAALSSYVTTTTLTTTLNGYVTNSSLATTLTGYASSAQGALADTALQPTALNGYATQTWVTNQNYVVAGTNGAYASVAQGAKADTALQPAALPNGLTFDQMMGLVYAGL